jgi:DNA-binding SARP family transcriptional activator
MAGTRSPDAWRAPGPAKRLALLNGFELVYDRRRVALPMSAQRLVAYLALQERGLLRPHVAGMLWPEMREDRASADLRAVLWRMRHPAYGLVETTTTHLRLSPEVSVDLRESVEVAHRILQDPMDAPPPEVSVAMLSADVLPDWYDDWVIASREAFRQLRLHALEILCLWLLEGGRHALAVQAGLAAVAGEPLRESAHGVLIKAYLAEGNLAEAIRHFQGYEQLMRSELGLAASPRIRQLIPAPSRAGEPPR